MRRLGLACLSRSPREQAVWAWRRVAFELCCVPSSGAAVLSRGRGDGPPAFGGVGGRRPCGSRAGGGEWGGRGGGIAPWLPVSLSRGGGPRPAARTPLLRRLIPHVYASSAGVVGHTRAPRAACRRQVSLAGGGGAACVPAPLEVWPAGPAGWGVALPRSVPLPSLGRQQSGCHWRCSGYGGRGPHTAPVRVHVLSPGVTRAPSSCAGAGSLACRCPRGSRWPGSLARVCVRAQLRPPPPGHRGPFGGRRDVPSAQGGWRAVAPVACRPEGEVGGEGGGSRCGSPPPFSGRAACGPWPGPPSSPARSPVVHLFGRGLSAAPGPGRGLAGRRLVSLAGGGGRLVRRPPLGALRRSVSSPPPPYRFLGRCRPPQSTGRP